MQRLITPITTEILVSELEKAGFIGISKYDYPLVSEVEDKLVFVAYSPEAGHDWIISYWDLKAKDFRYVQYANCDTLEQAILAFNNFNQSLLLDKGK